MPLIENSSSVPGPTIRTLVGRLHPLHQRLLVALPSRRSRPCRRRSKNPRTPRCSCRRPGRTTAVGIAQHDPLGLRHADFAVHRVPPVLLVEVHLLAAARRRTGCCWPRRGCRCRRASAPCGPSRTRRPAACSPRSPSGRATAAPRCSSRSPAARPRARRRPRPARTRGAARADRRPRSAPSRPFRAGNCGRAACRQACRCVDRAWAVDRRLEAAVIAAMTRRLQGRDYAEWHRRMPAGLSTDASGIAVRA